MIYKSLPKKIFNLKLKKKNTVNENFKFDDEFVICGEYIEGKVQLWLVNRYYITRVKLRSFNLSDIRKSINLWESTCGVNYLIRTDDSFKADIVFVYISKCKYNYVS